MLGAGVDGQLLNRHRKVMPTMAERMWWGQGSGDSLHAVQTESGRVGALICWEHWMPLTRAALHATSEDVHVAAWPRVWHWQSQLHALPAAVTAEMLAMTWTEACSVCRIPPSLRDKEGRRLQSQARRTPAVTCHHRQI